MITGSNRRDEVEEAGAPGHPTGGWFIANGRLPGWMRGPLKWPLGNTLTPRIVIMQGWAGIFVGLALLEIEVAGAIGASGLALFLVATSLPLLVVGITVFLVSTVMSRSPRTAS